MKSKMYKWKNGGEIAPDSLLRKSGIEMNALPHENHIHIP